MARQSLKDILWPDVTKPEKAHYAADQGFWVLLLVVFITTIITLIGLLEPWTWIVVGLYVLLAVGVRMRMRTAAVVAFVLYLADRLAAPITGGGGIVIALLFTLILLNAVRGTFALHRLRTAGAVPTDLLRTPRLRKSDIISFAVLIGLLIGAFSLIRGETRTNLLQELQKELGTEESSDERSAESPSLTLPNGTKFALTSAWTRRDEESKDTPGAIVAEYEDEKLWMLMQEETKEQIKRDLGDDYVGEMTLQEYAEAVNALLTEDMTDVETREPISVSIKGNACLRSNIEGVSDGVRLTFESTVCDGGSFFLRATVWGLASTFETHRKQVEELMGSVQW